MLQIVCGRAGYGKTAYILNEIAKMVKAREKGALLLVPEQFSHESERALAALCGDELSLYAEVLSFSRLCNRVFTECGGLSDVIPDKASQLLIMCLALKNAAPSLRVYNRQSSKSDFLTNLLKTRDELSACMINPDSLLKASALCGGAFGDKLFDMAMICNSYDTMQAKYMSDPRSKLVRLKDKLAQSSVGSSGKIFIDGFTDFTAEEAEIIDELLKKDAELCVTLCVDFNGDEAFELTLSTFFRLKEMAETRFIEVQIVEVKDEPLYRKPDLSYLEKNLFNYSENRFGSTCEAIELYAMNDIVSECSLAASRVLDQLRENASLRLSDIAVAARGFDKYEAVCESVFASYGLPVFIARNADILQKPVITLIMETYEILSSNWQYINVFRYLKTNLCGIGYNERDELENYCLTWNVRGESMWRASLRWDMNPRGYVTEETEKDKNILSKVNKTKQKIAVPLLKFKKESNAAETAAGQAEALYNYLLNIRLPEQLDEKTKELSKTGELQLAAEYAQLWDILVTALEQISEILGDLPIEREEFGKLLTLMLSSYDVSSIPVALDRITLCELENLRGKPLKCLVLLGATDSALPLTPSDGGLFSTGERDRMRSLGIELRDSGGMDISRELHLIYTALSKASDHLIISYPQSGRNGKTRPSFLFSRISAIFNKSPVFENAIKSSYLLSSPSSAFQYALSGADNEIALAAEKSLEKLEGWREQLEDVKMRIGLPRGSLNSTAVASLYGQEFNITASRTEKFNSCRFAYFMQYGLRAKPRMHAGFEAPEMGTFIHYILENVTREVSLLGGFKKAETEAISAITDKYIAEYSEKLIKKAKKTSRFIYLFSRLKDSVLRVVLDIAAELSASDFEPLDFELHFSPGGDMPPAEIKTDDLNMTVSGLVDRVDGWVHGGQLFLKVCDYKTGRKEFNFTDVYYGIGLQMLVYLFVLQNHGKSRYKREIIPAGVIYTPTRDVILQMPRSSSGAVIEKERIKALSRSGLVLNDEAVIEAMENPGAENRIPVTIKKGKVSGNIASIEHFGKLARHIEKLLIEMGSEMKKGNIDADPFVHGTTRSACDYCQFAEACRFDEKRDKPRRIHTLKKDEFWERIDIDGH